MINRRKKYRRDVKDEMYDRTSSREKIKRDALVVGDITDESKSSNPVANGLSYEDYLGSVRGSSLRKNLNDTVNKVQAELDDRQDAEESNLDVLDRGSRYTRKNEKLKKFKVD